MSLDALAPDQRAVVQLVLQQDRSYEQLAGLLGISVDAVRDRAHKGLARIAPPDDLAADELPLIADYLLGQQSDGQRDGTRLVLAGSPAARSWARTVAAELAGVARSPLPDIPEDDVVPVATPDPEAAPVAAAAAASETPRTRSRPRPRPARDESRPATAAAAAAAGSTATTPKTPRRGRADLRGGALLIGGIAILIVAVVILLVSGGDDKSAKTKTTASTSSTSPTGSPTATPTAQFQQLGGLALKSPTGGKAKGQMVIFANSNGGIAFTIQGTGVPASGTGEAYAVWLTGGDAPHRLGFAPQVKADGKLGTSGPRDQDAKKFAQWFAQAKKVVVSKETSETAKAPGPEVLEGTIPTGSGSATATPTATAGG